MKLKMEEGKPAVKTTRSWLLLAEGHLRRRLFGAMVRRGPEGTPALPVPAV